MITFDKKQDSNGTYDTITVSSYNYGKTLDVKVSTQLYNICPGFVLEVLADQFLDDSNKWFDIFDASQLRYPDQWTPAVVAKEGLVPLKLVQSSTPSHLVNVYIGDRLIADNLVSTTPTAFIVSLISALSTSQEFEVYQDIDNNFYIKTKLNSSRYNGIYMNIYDKTTNQYSDMQVLDGTNFISGGIDFNSSDTIILPLVTLTTTSNPTAITRTFSL